MTLSIVIPSYNSLKTIEKLFENIDYNNENIIEVIIADSSPVEEHNKLIKIAAKYSKTKVLRLNERTMPAIARNRGAAEATGDLLVFIDSDAYPAADWLDKIISAYRSGVLVGGGAIELPPFQEKKAIAVSQYYLQFNEYIPTGKARRKGFAPSCNLFCDRKLFLKVDGFPEIRASEDVLFGKIVNEESPFLFIPDSKVFHIFGEDFKRLKSNQRLLGKYVAIYRKKENNSLKKSFIVHIWLFPFLPIIKLALLFPRILKAERFHLKRLILSLPFVLIGLIFWSLGYLDGFLAKEEFNVE